MKATDPQHYVAPAYIPPTPPFSLAHAAAIRRYGLGTQALADWEDFNLRGPL